MGLIWGKIPKSSLLQVKGWGYLVCVLWSTNGPYLGTRLLWNVPEQDQGSGGLGSSTASASKYRASLWALFSQL